MTIDLLVVFDHLCVSLLSKSSSPISSRSSTSSSESISDRDLRQIISARSKQRSRSQPARTRQSSLSSSSKESFVQTLDQPHQQSNLTSFTNTHETMETTPFFLNTSPTPVPPIPSPLRLDQLDSSRIEEKPKKRSASLNRVRADSPAKPVRRVSSELDAEEKAIANE